MFLADQWQDYEVLDTGDGEKLERWNDVILRRPDPQVIWPKGDEALWERAQAHYHRSEKGGGHWEFLKQLPQRWTVNCMGIDFYVRPTGFKHTGLFPEQAANWAYMGELIEKRVQSGREVKVLNLFGYTGGASMACAKAGAHVTHVDAAKGMVQWAKENRELAGLDESAFRFIVEDALQFVKREIRRANSYQGIVMDPPSFGRGPNGEVWKLEDELYHLVSTCQEVLAGDGLFLIINSYTTGFQSSVLANILKKCVQDKRGGRVAADELGLPVTAGGVLPCGCTGRWQADE